MDVSIIIPYNKDRGFLAECLESCNKQQFSGVFEVIPYFGDQIVSKNINQALTLATGEFIKIIAEDDLLTENCLQILHDNIGDADLICANARHFGRTEKIFYSSIPLDLRTFALDNTIHGATMLYRRSSLDKIAINGQVFREDLWTAEEYELHMRMMRAKMKFRYINEIVALYRNWDGQKSIGKHTGEYIDARYDMILAIKNEYNTP